MSGQQSQQQCLTASDCAMSGQACRQPRAQTCQPAASSLLQTHLTRIGLKDSMTMTIAAEMLTRLSAAALALRSNHTLPSMPRSASNVASASSQVTPMQAVARTTAHSASR